jgi:hypothetical protein
MLRNHAALASLAHVSAQADRPAVLDLLCKRQTGRLQSVAERDAGGSTACNASIPAATTVLNSSAQSPRPLAAFILISIAFSSTALHLLYVQSHVSCDFNTELDAQVAY